MRLHLVLLALAAGGCATARSAPPPQLPASAPARPAAEAGRPADDSGGSGGGGERPAAGEPNPRPYAQVVTSRAITRDGLFRTHRIGGKLFYEIPRRELGRDMLLVTQIAKTTAGVGYGGTPVGNRVLRWERRDNRILLRNVSYELVADSTQPIYQAVEAANYAPVIAAFNVEAWGPDSTAVIDVSRLFTSSVAEFGVGGALRGALDAGRTFLERVAAFPENVEVEATQTYTVTPSTPPGLPEAFRPQPRTVSALVHWSMLRLPERPMMPRLHDSRVGYFSVGKQDFTAEGHRVSQRRYITRWRLEPKDPAALARGELTEPVKPIVFYVDAATPAQWRPWISRGIEDWQKAFEAAGFRNAIVAKDAPTAQEDADWSAEDARYSVIRWLPSTIENAMGPHVHDPRTGEILEADILIYHNVLNLLRDWYFVQAGPLDARARALPLPDSLMGRLLQYVVTHEVGHSLGFPHNMKASATYSADSIRNVDFLRRMGHTPTLMDYSRFNYVAQPEDGIPPALLIPEIGPYDRFATRWGYRPIPGAATPEAERGTLDAWAREQDAKPYLRFNTSGTMGADPGDQTEAVGDADAVKSTRLGLQNLRRVVPMLIPAATRPAEDFGDLRELYDRLVGQWATELSHVVTVVGGVDSQEKYGSQEGVRFEPLPRARQAEAVRFLNEQAFGTPHFLLEPAILRRIEVEGAIERIGRAQARVLNGLFSDARLERLVEFEAMATRPGEAYTLGEMLRDVRQGIWSELAGGSVRVDPFRRNLQRTYLQMVNGKLNPREPQVASPFPGMVAFSLDSRPVGDARALLRAELRSLDAQLAAALPRAADPTSRAHLLDARAQIQRILEPKG